MQTDYVYRPKVCLCYTVFGPYHIRRLRELSKSHRFEVIGLETVGGKGQTDIEQWRYADRDKLRIRTLFPEANYSDLSRSDLKSACVRAFDHEAPDVVLVPGWSTIEALVALNWCLTSGGRSICMSDSLPRTGLCSHAKAVVRRRLARLFDAALVAGTKHASHAESLGFDRRAIFTGYDVVDNGHFRDTGSGAPGCGAPRTGSSAESCCPFFLAVCRFIPEKNISTLLRAFGLYVQSCRMPPWKLVLLGDGPLMEDVKVTVRRLNLDGNVLLPGFVGYTHLPAYYRRASAFILPSISETWGLTVNEAMAAGLPVIVSKHCGCAPDLIEEGRNGMTFDPCNVEELANLMFKVSTMSDDRREAMGQASRQIISRWTPETFADNLWQAVEVALTAPRPKATLLDKALLSALMHRPQ